MELSARKLKFFRLTDVSPALVGHLIIEVEGDTTPSGAPLRYIVSKTEETALRMLLDGKAGV